MNWDAIGASAELLGAIGVIASLLYLSVQIRQNTRSVRAATYASLAEATTNSNALIISENQLASILASAFSGETLNAEEFQKFDAYMRMTFRRYDTIHFHHQQGTLTEDVWNGYWNSLNKILPNPIVQRCWKRHSDEYTKAFRVLVTRELAVG